LTENVVNICVGRIAGMRPLTGGLFLSNFKELPTISNQQPLATTPLRSPATDDPPSSAPDVGMATPARTQCGHSIANLLYAHDKSG